MTTWVMNHVREVLKDLLIITSGITLFMIVIRFLA
jgi:hypothetical protein